MDKIFELLGIEKLDESKQNELKETMRTVVELKANELAESRVNEMVESEKERLVEEFERKFDEYKDGIISKFSNFVDKVLDEELIIPENVKRYAKLGELYQDLIEQFKTRLAIDEGMINKEVTKLLQEAKEEIESLRATIDENTGKILELESDASEMAAQLYIRQKCDGLTESQKAKVIDLIGDEVVKENIDKKFKTIVESLSILNEEDDYDDDDKDDEGSATDRDGDGDGVFEAVCSECGNKETVKEGDDMKCPECGGKMVKKGKEKNKKVVKESVDNGLWKTYKDIWLNSLKTDK